MPNLNEKNAAAMVAAVRRLNRLSPLRDRRKFTLMEICVSIAVFAIGILTALAILVPAVRWGAAAKTDFTAAECAMDFVSQIHSFTNEAIVKQSGAAYAICDGTGGVFGGNDDDNPYVAILTDANAATDLTSFAIANSLSAGDENTRYVKVYKKLSAGPLAAGKYKGDAARKYVAVTGRLTSENIVYDADAGVPALQFSAKTTFYLPALSVSVFRLTAPLRWNVLKSTGSVPFPYETDAPPGTITTFTSSMTPVCTISADGTIKIIRGGTSTLCVIEKLPNGTERILGLVINVY